MYVNDTNIKRFWLCYIIFYFECCHVQDTTQFHINGSQLQTSGSFDVDADGTKDSYPLQIQYVAVYQHMFPVEYLLSTMHIQLLIKDEASIGGRVNE